MLPAFKSLVKLAVVSLMSLVLSHRPSVVSRKSRLDSILSG